LKGAFNPKTLHRSRGVKELINVNGRPIIQKPTLMFANTANVRPFNFRNTATEVANWSANTEIQLVEGKNARGYAPVIQPGDPRLAPEFTEMMGTNKEGLRRSMARNKAERSAGVNRPSHNFLRVSKLNKSRRPAKHMFLGATQHEMGYPNQHLNKLWFQGANAKYLKQEQEKMKRLYLKHGQENVDAAIRAAEIDEFEAQQIAENNYNPSGGKSHRTRRSRKTRRNRK
jgi:hypothetical protein